MNERSEDAVTVEMNLEVDEEKIREFLRSEFRSRFMVEHIYTCETCGLVWMRDSYYQRSDNQTECPDCGERERTYITNI